MRKLYSHKLGATNYIEKESPYKGQRKLQTVFPKWYMTDKAEMMAMIAEDFKNDPLLKQYDNRYHFKVLCVREYDDTTSFFVCFEGKK